jgi:fructokinase
MPLKQDLETALARDVRLANDANCFALAEALEGAGRGASLVFGVILGTGVGGGIVVDGEVLLGANAIAGEWGHNPMPWPRPEEWPGPTCYCGRTGCIETFLCGPALSADYARAGGKALDTRAIATRAYENEAIAVQCLTRYHDRLARALAHVVNVLDPEVIVLGGGVSNIANLYEAIPRIWSEYIFSDHVRTRLVKHGLGDSAGVLGAAWLW